MAKQLQVLMLAVVLDTSTSLSMHEHALITGTSCTHSIALSDLEAAMQDTVCLCIFGKSRNLHCKHGNILLSLHAYCADASNQTADPDTMPHSGESRS